MIAQNQNQYQSCYIALNGLPESGKTEVAKWLIEHHNFRRIGFGDHLKRAAILIYNLSHDQVYGDLKDVVDLRYNLTPRFILQQLGTNVCRSIHPDTWVFPIQQALSSGFDSYRRVVIDDLRFPNEVEMLLNYGTVLIQIERPNHNPTDLEINHESNRPLLTKFDLTISNDSDIAALHTKLETLAQILKL